MQKCALSAKTQTRMPRVLKEKKKKTAKKHAFNRFASNWVCVETDLQWDGSVSKRVAVRRSASKRSRSKVLFLSSR